MHVKTSRDWEDLHFLIIEAHKLAERLFMKSDEYRFDFPNINERYSRLTMVSREPHIQQFSPDELERRATVKLGVSPAVMVRTNTQDTISSPAMVQPAHVILKIY